MRRVSRAAAVGATLACIVAITPAASADTRFSPGAQGIGEAYFPFQGNGGFDVGHYDLKFAYDPDYDQLDGVTTINATATQNLSRFDLDLDGLDVSKVTVNGHRARFTRKGPELIITPRHGLRKGRTFTVSVTYGGVPKTIVGSPIVFGSPYGFLHTPDGAFVGGEPDGSATWFPGSDHPSDKATFDFTITVPKGLAAVSNGVLTSQHDRTASFSRRSAPTGASTFRWHEASPMTTYLATIDIGKWEVKKGTTPGGTPNYVAVDPVLLQSQPNAVSFFFDTTSEATDLLAKTFGRYPFATTGAIADDARFNGQPLGFSLETQTKPVYSAVRSTATIAHELAHQWFGDSVSPRRWKDVWLNESFATFAQWMWSEKHGGRTVYDQARTTYNARAYPDPAGSPYWSVMISDPQRDTMFNQRVYSGGGMVLQFLREKLGDDAFFKVLRTWVADHRYGTATTEEFVAHAQKVSGQDLTEFFKTWIYSTGKPPLPSS